MQLRPYHEIIGVIRDIIDGEDEVKIIFSMDKEIDISKLDVPKEITRELIGQRIGIININNKYHFRRV
jgi:hypothetical protein